MRVPADRPSAARQRADGGLLVLAGLVVAAALLIPWVHTEDGTFFGPIDEPVPERLTAWQRFGFEDLALLGVAVLLGVVGLLRLRGPRARAGLVVAVAACIAAGAFAAVQAVDPSHLGDLQPGPGTLVLGASPAAGPFVALTGLGLGCIVALAALMRRPRGATV